MAATAARRHTRRRAVESVAKTALADDQGHAERGDDTNGYFRVGQDVVPRSAHFVARQPLLHAFVDGARRGSPYTFTLRPFGS